MANIKPRKISRITQVNTTIELNEYYWCRNKKKYQWEVVAMMPVMMVGSFWATKVEEEEGERLKARVKWWPFSFVVARCCCYKAKQARTMPGQPSWALQAEKPVITGFSALGIPLCCWFVFILYTSSNTFNSLYPIAEDENRFVRFIRSLFQAVLWSPIPSSSHAQLCCFFSPATSWINCMASWKEN